MTVNIGKLRNEMENKGFKVESLAQRIGIDRSTFYRKLQDKGLSFTVGEMLNIVEALHLTEDEASCIFLYKNSQ